MSRTPSRLPSSLFGLGLTAVLALPFALIGTVLAHRTVWTVITTWTMQSWPTAPATLQHVELEAQGSNSKRTRATYSYLVDGRSFNGQTVTLYGADNLGSFQQRAYDELQGYFSRRAPYSVHFNPREPGESILMPVVRWEAVSFSLIFVVLFGGVGFGLLIAAYSGYRRLRIEAALVAQYPNEPWRHRIEWSTGRIQSDQNSAARGAVILAVMWNVCSWPMVFAVPEKLQAGEYGGLLLLLFPALGLGLIYWAIVSLAGTGHISGSTGRTPAGSGLCSRGPWGNRGGPTDDLLREERQGQRRQGHDNQDRDALGTRSLGPGCPGPVLLG
jgi:hypothetical protein